MLVFLISINSLLYPDEQRVNKYGLSVGCFYFVSGLNKLRKIHGPPPFKVEVLNLTDSVYPDIGFRSASYQAPPYFDRVLIGSSGLEASFQFVSVNLDTIGLYEIQLNEAIPTIPESLKNSKYLQLISCVKQERNPIKFGSTLPYSNPRIKL